MVKSPFFNQPSFSNSSTNVIIGPNMSESLLDLWRGDPECYAVERYELRPIAVRLPDLLRPVLVVGKAERVRSNLSVSQVRQEVRELNQRGDKEVYYVATVDQSII